MDDRSTTRLLWQELAGAWRERRMWGSLRSWGLSLYDRLARRMHWRRFRWRGRPVSVRVRGHRQPFIMRLGSSDALVLNEMVLGDEYGPAIRYDMGEVRQVVDLGANAGFSLRQWRAHFPEARIIGVEPDGANVDMCRRNMAVAGDVEGRGDRLTLLQACAAGEDGEVHLNVGVAAWSYAMTADQGEHTVAVPAMSMVSILEAGAALPEVDLLKCDIEGAERELFADCAAWIGRVRHIVIELHKDVYAIDDMLADLQRNGWSCGGHKVLSDHYHMLAFLWRAPRADGTTQA